MGRALYVTLAVVFVVATTSLAGPVGGQDTTGASGPAIERVYPNPVASGDAGEYVVLSVPASATLANATLSDGKRTVSLANVSRRGHVAISTVPDATADITDVPVADADGLELANGGETLTLHVDGEVASRLRYDDAPEGKVGVRSNGHLRWQPLGATDFEVAAAGPGEVRAFVLPDSPDVPLDLLENAEERIRLGGYTLSSERVATALIDANRRGVDVRVLLEGKPVGGRSRADATQLDRLADAGVDVHVVAGEHARVDYHHAKYAVADDRALVMTENWKPSGTGGNASRGWGVVTDQPAVVANLTATFEADAGWRDGLPWNTFRQGRSFERGEKAVGEYPEEFAATDVAVDRTELLVTPDNGGDRLVELLDDADESISVVQASLGDWDGRLPTALRRAAQRDVEVRLLLSSAWYSEDENRQTVERFQEWADRTGASLDARLAAPDGRFEKIHTKGAIVDEKRVVVGSLNWNDAAMSSNREVLLVLHGTEAADYFEQVFDADWSGGDGWSFPVGLVLAVVGTALLAGAVLVKIRFENREESAGIGPVEAGDQSGVVDDRSGVVGDRSGVAGDRSGVADDHQGIADGRPEIAGGHSGIPGADPLREDQQRDSEGDAPDADGESDE